jgi:hypothetical protein
MLPIFSAWRRKDADKEAKEVEIRNSRISCLHRLPPELILCILDHMEGVDALSFHLSCRRYAFLMKPELKSKMTKNDKKELKERLGSDRYSKLAEAESSDVANLERLLCSRCRYSHPRSMFRESEILQSPHIRCCNGVKNVFRACPHLELTFDEVKAELGSNGRGICSLSCNMYPRILTGYGRHDGFSFISNILRLIILEDEGVSRAQVQTIFKDLAEPLCPHMRTDSPHVQDRLSTALCHRSRISIAHRVRSPFDKRHDFTYPFETAKMRIDCVAKNCMTGLKISRIGNFLDVSVIRDVGDFKFATNPKWCAQLEGRSAAEIEEHRQEMQELLGNYFPINAIQAQHQRLRALLAGLPG